MMKKLGLLVLIAGLSLTGLSQNAFKKVEIVGGPGLAHVFGGSSWNPTFGFMVGAETNAYQFSENSALRVGINFTMQGASYKDEYSYEYFGSLLKSAQDVTEEYSGKATFTYIYVPILYAQNVSDVFSIEAGIQPGFLLSAKDKYDGGSDDWKDVMKGFEFGIAAGGIYTLTDNLSFGVRAVFGIPSFYSDDADMYTSDEDRNFFAVAMVRFALPAGK